MDTIVALLSVAVGLLTFRWGIKSFQDQMNAQLFLNFTKRFEEIMQSFPKGNWPGRLDLEGPLPLRSKALSASILRYLNLCSEEYYLYREGMLNKKIWKIWEAELIRTLQTDLFIREWQELCREFEAYPEFKEYVDARQREAHCANELAGRQLEVEAWAS